MSKPPHTFCHYCGVPLLGLVRFPRTCARCKQVIYVNPAPVVVLLIPASSSPNGVIGHKRGIEPEKGKWALPSGYVDLGETWQEAALREFEEELGFKPPVAASGLKVWSVETSTNTQTILIFVDFCVLIPVPEDFVPNEEVLDLKLCTDPSEFCWSLHQGVTSDYLTFRRPFPFG